MGSSLVGFCGSRKLAGGQWASLVGRVARAVQAAGWGVAVGCASGADLLVRQSVPNCQVFSVASGQWGSGRGAFARRSIALVRAVAAFPSLSHFVGFVISACPAGIAPARFWRSGSPPSGSWSSLALAAGRGVPVLIFWCGPGAAQLPAWGGGSWQPVQAGPFAGAFQFVPAQAKLF